MAKWINDEQLFETMRNELYSPVIGDILDQLGFYHQILSPKIQPLRLEDKLAGRAMPSLFIEIYEPQERPFGLMCESLDQLNPNEIYVGTGTVRCSMWGEIMTATAKQRGAIGAIVNGYHRDTPTVMEQNFPVWSWGRFAQDSSVRTKVIDYRCPIEIGGVRIEPGDLIFADLDGIVIIPRENTDEVIEKAIEKARGEKKVRSLIEKGMTSLDAFNKYGIL